MAERSPLDDATDLLKASTGFYPHLKRNRTVQNPEAAKNVPVDLARGALSGVLGAPGDIESLVRMLPYLNEKTVLPTSEDIEKRIPFKSDTPVSRAATGLGQIAGGFYNGPGSPLRVIGALPGAIKHGAEEFAKASVAGAPHVMKPVGGNWIPNEVENAVKHLKRKTPAGSDVTDILRQMKERYTPEAIAGMQEGSRNNILENIAMLERDVALNNWVDSNLTNYLKKQMGSEKDPVRMLADEGITHYSGQGAMRNALDTSYEQFAQNRKLRKKLGMPEEPMAKGPMGRIWEEGIDSLLDQGNMVTAKQLKGGNLWRDNPWLQNLPPDSTLYRLDKPSVEDMNLQHILDVLREDLVSGRIKPEDVKNISMDRAVRRAHEYNQEMAEKLKDAKAKKLEQMTVYKDYPEEGYKWVQLEKPGDFAAESDAMGHSVRGYEPRKGHPDWVESSGDRGNPSYGLGGWEAIKRGDAKIYSLVDTKGEPHVTIEVGSDYDSPAWYQKNKKLFESDTRIPSKNGQWDNVKLLHSWYNDNAQSASDYVHGISKYLDEAGIPYVPAERTIPKIHQIKGKGNARPVEKYDPFTQDFVFSDKWDDVLDLHHTGLKTLDDAFPDYEMKKYFNRTYPDKKYVNQKDIDDWTQQWNNPQPPQDGMKSGGVVVSKNPDTMMLELNNKRMKEGGSESDTKPYFGGAGTKKYAAAKKRAELGDVNLLKDPKTYAAVAGLLGEAPDEMGFSVMHPDYQSIRNVADPAFYAGTALGVAPLAKVLKAPTMALGRAGEKYAEKVVPQIMERGGMGADILGGLAQGSQSRVIKPTGGNWFGTSVDDAMNRLKPYNTPSPDDNAFVARQKAEWEAKPESDARTRALRAINDEIAVNARNTAINNWIDRNLGNYVKKQMATPDDPVRKLAEEGIIHIPTSEVGINRYRAPKHRELYEGQQLGQSEAAKAWEDASDVAINAPKVELLQSKSFLERNPWMEKLPMEQRVYALNNPAANRQEIMGLGFDHILDVLRQDVAAGRIRPEQLNKVSMEQAVRRTFEFDQEMARKMRETALKQQEGFPVHKEYPEGYKWIELAPQPKDALRKKHEEYVRRDFPDIEKYDPYGFEEYVKDSMNSSRVIDQQQLADALKYEGNTMGHCVGGYCPDVVEGKSRIFSLRDAKGEPHVTIEVQPNRYAPRHEDVKQYMTAAEEEAKALPQGYTDRDVSDIAVRMAKENAPQNIIQIKGKQNAAPKADYLPYVQDFVGGGKWGEVGDLKNTGMVDMNTYRNLSNWLKERGIEHPRYVTKEQFGKHEGDYLLDELKPSTPPDVPPEGMKRGGVAISHNPDTMMLELGERKMQAGGIAKLVKGIQTAAKVEPELMKASEALGKIEGRPLRITQADRTKVGGGYLGGPGFSGLQLTDPEYRAAEAAWAVQNAGTAKTILGGGSDNAVYAAMLGTPTQHQSNQMVFDKLYGDFKKAAKRGELTPELRDLINMRLASAVDKKGTPVFPADVDILDKNFRNIADTFSRRSIAGHLMGGVQVGGKKGQIIDYDKIIRNTTDPVLLDQPTGAIGNRLFTLSGGIINRPDLHPAFPTILQGEDLGVVFTPVERDIVMKDFVDKTMREKGRKPGYMDYTRGNPPTQLITEDILTELQKLGLKKGGTVKKAEGGAITGDDLIIEERPL